MDGDGQGNEADKESTYVYPAWGSLFIARGVGGRKRQGWSGAGKRGCDMVCWLGGLWK